MNSENNDPTIEEIERVSIERDRYYAEWKRAQNEIREVRRSLMWRISKLSVTAGRLVGRAKPDWWTGSLVEAIEAEPPTGKDPEPVPVLSPDDLLIRRQRLEMADRRAHLERVIYERDGYHGEWRHAQNRLELIRSSEMWGGWQSFRAFLSRLKRSSYGLKELGRSAVSFATAPVRVMQKVPGYLVAVPGTIYTAVWAAWALLLARFRTRHIPHTSLDTIEVLPDPRGFRPRVLIVSPYHIYPPNHGSGARLTRLIRELGALCDVYVLVFSRTGERPGERAGLEPICKRVDFHRWQPGSNRDRLGVAPYVKEIFDSPTAATKIRDIVVSHDIDLVQLEHTELGQYLDAAGSDIPVIITEHDIAFRSHWRRRRLGFHSRFPESAHPRSSTMDTLRLVRYEIGNCRRAHQIHVMSEVDSEFLARFMPDGGRRIRVMPNGVDCSGFAAPVSDEPRRGLLFVGNFNHMPNVDAAEFLLRDIWPLVRLRRPEATLTLVGTNPSERVRRLADVPGVVLKGDVPDPRPFYHRHRVMAVPIRAGSGTRLKILEAFAAGIPVVSTTLGAEGIEAEDGTHLLIADRAMAFAKAIDRLMGDDELFESMAAAAALVSRQRYDWKLVAEKMYRAYLELIPEPVRERKSRDRTKRHDPSVARRNEGDDARPDVSVIIPTYRGGPDLEKCLDAVRRQKSTLQNEIICVDSGSDDRDLEVMSNSGARVCQIDQREFNHGLTRDLGASLARAEILVFMSQDAIPVRDDWLDLLTLPLRQDETGLIAAVQGGSREVNDPKRRFFWGCSGPRFYFTRETARWLGRYGGIGFSTANCAIRRSIWDRYRFGWANILEDKKWQRQVLDAGFQIVDLPEIEVFHSHDYDLRSLLRRCASEGHGWRTLGERYRLTDAVSDMCTTWVWRELSNGIQRNEIRKGAEVGFPILRPLALWWGNAFLRRVLH